MTAKIERDESKNKPPLRRSKLARLVLFVAIAEEDEDGNVLLATRCDGCGRSEEELGEE